jgi:hypothetical protein
VLADADPAADDDEVNVDALAVITITLFSVTVIIIGLLREGPVLNKGLITQRIAVVLPPFRTCLTERKTPATLARSRPSIVALEINLLLGSDDGAAIDAPDPVVVAAPAPAAAIEDVAVVVADAAIVVAGVEKPTGTAVVIVVVVVPVCIVVDVAFEPTKKTGNSTLNEKTKTFLVCIQSPLKYNFLSMTLRCFMHSLYLR